MLRVWVIRVQRGPVSDVWDSCYLIPPFWLFVYVKSAGGGCCCPFAVSLLGSDRFGPVGPVDPVVGAGVRIFVLLLFLASMWVDIVYLSLVAVGGRPRLFRDMSRVELSFTPDVCLVRVVLVLVWLQREKRPCGRYWAPELESIRG